METKIGYKVVSEHEGNFYSLTPTVDSMFSVRYKIGKWAIRNDVNHGPLFLYDTLENLMRVHRHLVRIKPFPVRVFKCEYAPSKETRYCPYRGVVFADQVKLLEEIEL